MGERNHSRDSILGDSRFQTLLFYSIFFAGLGTYLFIIGRELLK